MSAERIIAQIKKDSEKQIEKILKDAKSQARDIIQNANKEAELEAKKIENECIVVSENNKKIMISKANQDSKKEIMNAREKIIEDCFTKAHSELSKLKGNSYTKIVKKLVKDGCEKLGKNCVVMISREEDKKIAEDLGLKVEGKVESSGGVLLKSSNGKITLDHTFDGILKREKDKIRIEIGKLLFS
jgi:V/A-type H+-transporting ATPase subunit E